jgi:glutathione S-transferase
VRLWDADWAPNPRRVRIYLAEKGLSIDSRKVDLAAGAHLRPEFLALSPRGTVPVLELDDGETIADSVAICRYLEALHPEPPLFGRTPLDAARIDYWTRRIESEGYAAVADAFRNRSKHMVDRALPGAWPPIPQIPALAERGRVMFGLFVETLDARLADRPWIATDGYSFADLTAFVAVEFAIATRLSDGRFPAALARWHAALADRPSARA